MYDNNLNKGQNLHFDLTKRNLQLLKNRRPLLRRVLMSNKNIYYKVIIDSEDRKIKLDTNKKTKEALLRRQNRCHFRFFFYLSKRNLHHLQKKTRSSASVNNNT